MHFGHSNLDIIDITSPVLNKNYTQSTLFGNINRCVRPQYHPRVLRANQITWKKTEKAKGSKQRRNISSILNNATSWADLLDDDYESGQTKDNTSDIIYDFMAFAMLLPDHPFSHDLYTALSYVGPMFPNVNVVIGSGYEFKEMCSQYGVRSFPKLMFFTKGHLTSKYKGELEPSILAGEIARWTKSYPRAFPIAMNDWKHQMSKIVPSYKRNVHSQHVNDLISTLNIFGMEIPIRLPPSTEPIMGSAESLVEWDNSGTMLIISCVYVILRFFWWVWSRSSR